MKRKAILLLALVMLCGCGKSTEEEPVKRQDTDVNGDEQAESVKSETHQESDAGFQNGKMLGSIILEDEQFLYLCSPYFITKVDKVTGETEALWESEGALLRSREHFYSAGCAVLIGDIIYFLEEWMDESAENYGATKKAFSMIRTDGTGYERLEEKYITDLFVQEGMLYLNISEEDEYLTGYPVLADGSLAMEEGVKDTEEARGIPEEYISESYLDNGSHALSPVKSLYELGYYLIRNGNYELVRRFPDSGEEELLPDGLSEYSLQAFNDTDLLMSNYENDKRVYYLVDKQTMEKRPLMEYRWSVNIITMDEEYVYLQREAEDENHFKKYPFERIDLETGEATVLFEQEPFTGLGVTPSPYMADIVLQDGYIYYVGMQDYKLYMMRRSLEDLSVEEILGEAFYDSRIGEVGTAAYEYTEFFSNDSEESPNNVLGQDLGGDTDKGLEENNSGKLDERLTDVNEEEPCSIVDLTWLVVDERYPGAAVINSYMKETMNDSIRYGKDEADTVAEIRAEYDEDFPAYSISSSIHEITYVDDTYLSYCQAGYEYNGGAHGMPYRIGYTFNLQTGELLTLSDVIGNSEEELKEMVGRYFEEQISKEPENYWEGSVESVKEWTDFNSDYYLTEEGIRFYQGPYAISSYAAGFQEVTIPYSEFMLKIPVGEDSE